MATTERVRKKAYACKACGHEKELETNHYGECYSFGTYTMCPNCHDAEQVTVWVCQEAPPEGMGVPEPWRRVRLGDLVAME